MEDFKRQFINIAYSEFGIKANESINFEQAFAILDKMQALRMPDVVGRSEQMKVAGTIVDYEIDDNGVKIIKKFDLRSVSL